MQEHRIDGVSRTQVGHRDDWWSVSIVESENRRVAHVFPPEALHWRAAEYGLDPANPVVLLDVVLHERHISGHDHTCPDFLYNCDRDTARAALLARVADVKTRIRVTDPGGLLSQIHDAHVHVPEQHAERVSFVDHVRTHGTTPRREPDRG